MPDDNKPTNPNKPVEAGAEGEKKNSPGEKEKIETDANVKETAGKLDDKLAQPGALEVEEMPESSELQDRREKTKDQLQDMVTEDDIEAAFEGDDGGIIGMLKDANLSPKHLKFCCGGVFVVLLIGALIWGGISLVPKMGEWFERDGDDVVEDVEEEEDVDFDYGDFEEEYGFLDPSVYVGVLIGEEVAEVDEATEAGEELGEELVSDDSLAVLIADFADMYEAMKVDVQELLDASYERQETLDDYRHELNYLLYTGRQNLEDLEASNEYITEKFTAAEEEKDMYEARYFDKMRELDAYGSVSALNAFIAEAEEVVNLRAQYQAREKLISYYEELIVSMEARVADLELNEEALVKGVKVYDIEGSDIDLIIGESEL